MKRFINLAVILLLLLVTACGEKAHEHADGTAYTCPMHPQIVQDEPGTCPICFMDLVPVSQSGKNSGELMLSDNQIALGNIATKRIKFGNTNSSPILTGRLAVDETQTDVISSRAQGRIEKLYIKETGQPVKKGQPLYQLYSEQLLTLQREYLMALDQYRELGQQEPRFTSFLDAAKRKLLLFGLTEGQVNNLARSGRVDATITFLSPVSGIVTEVAAAEGMYVPEGGLLYRLANLSRLWVEAELYPQEATQVQVGDSVQVTVQGTGQNSVKSRISFVNPELRAGGQVVVVRAEIPNRNGNLIPGMQANLMLTESGKEALVLPADAVIRDESGTHVWVQTGKNTFKARMVKLGDESFNNVTITDGLKENEKVVTSGAYLLYSEFVLKKGADPMAGHAH